MDLRLIPMQVFWHILWEVIYFCSCFHNRKKQHISIYVELISILFFFTIFGIIKFFYYSVIFIKKTTLIYPIQFFWKKCMRQVFYISILLYNYLFTSYRWCLIPDFKPFCYLNTFMNIINQRSMIFLTKIVFL